ncbi:hypothetical protein GCM10010495_35300 [Kitasatospora herbaricolor]|nr:hypothetical protein GCM10010495_35300 [Kitasatospora herbaricolor]
MLTRLEVDGFKNLLDLAVELGPFTCIAGANGTGKSNVFDAIQFLSLLADRSLMEAAQEVRGTHSERHGDARDLFWNGYAPGGHRMRFAAEMIVAPEPTEDDFGRLSEPPTSSFLRYELELGYQPPRWCREDRPAGPAAREPRLHPQGGCSRPSALPPQQAPVPGSDDQEQAVRHLLHLDLLGGGRPDHPDPPGRGQPGPTQACRGLPGTGNRGVDGYLQRRPDDSRRPTGDAVLAAAGA